jgi:hypothetical protein
VRATCSGAAARREELQAIWRTVSANCGMENPAARTNCLKCGSPSRIQRLGQACPSWNRSRVVAQYTTRKINWLVLGGVGAALLACCVAAVFLFFVPTASLQATVTDVHWQTSVPLQEQREVNYSNEQGSPPGDAYNVSCHTESRQVCEKVVDQEMATGKVQDCAMSAPIIVRTPSRMADHRTYTLDGHDFSPVYSQPMISIRGWGIET